MIAFKVYAHMVQNNDIFHASYIAANAQHDVAEKYNGEVDGDYIKFVSLSEDNKKEITTIYPFIVEDKFVFFHLPF
jgi:hypothetical protein